MNQRIRVLYIQPNSEIGGSDICLLRMIQALDKEQFEPIVVLPYDGPLVPAFRREGAQVRFVPMMQLRTTLSPAWQTGYAVRFWPSVVALKRLIVRENAAIVHTNSLYNLYGAWAAWLASRPHVWHVREIPPNIPVARSLLAAFVRRMSARVLSMTAACEQSLFAGKPPDNAGVLYEGISLDEFRPAEISGARVRAEMDIETDAPVVGFVGRLDPWKGLDVFLRAAALVHPKRPDVHFLIAGGAPKGFENHEAEMHRLAGKLGLDSHVHFAGFRYGAADIPEVMASFTLLAHTSIQPEPFGLVLIEAMAMGRPVIATKMGGPLEIMLDGKTGILVEPGKADVLAESMLKLLDNPQELQRTGEAARRRVEQMFPVSGFQRRLTSIYLDIPERPVRMTKAAAV